MQQYSIGAVTFAKDGEEMNLIGTERVAMLRRAFLRQPLPDGVVMRTDRYSWPRFHPLTWDEVRWDTAGATVTGAGTNLPGEVIRDPEDRYGWRVVYAGLVCSPTWNSRGAAEAYLHAVQSGARQPEFSADHREAR